LKDQCLAGNTWPTCNTGTVPWSPLLVTHISLSLAGQLFLSWCGCRLPDTIVTIISWQALLTVPRKTICTLAWAVNLSLTIPLKVPSEIRQILRLRSYARSVYCKKNRRPSNFEDFRWWICPKLWLKPCWYLNTCRRFELLLQFMFDHRS
jgi:hypothetical protein